jgi:hypothetical protein
MSCIGGYPQIHDGAPADNSARLQVSKFHYIGSPARVPRARSFGVSLRDSVGETVTAWMSSNPDVRVLKMFVMLCPDRQFHCLSMVLIGSRV